MLNFVDISHHNWGVPLSALPIDGAICKATEGTSFVDPRCDSYINTLIKNGKLFGFYHFANRYSPIEECEHFLNNTINWRGLGIPALDWEGYYIDGKFHMQPASYVNEFVRHYFRETGVWCWVYSNPSNFNGADVESNCGRWIAKWPNVIHPDFSFNPNPIPKVDGLVCAWQYCSDGRIGGYNKDLDLNKFYGTKEAWLKYAKAKGNEHPDMPTSSFLENEKYRITVERK